MKKSTIWILGIVMGLSFLGLLYLQVSYIEAMVKMRKEQFDNSVRNSLYQVSKDVEFAETDRWLREDITEAERKALTASSSMQGDDLVQQTQRFTVKSSDGRIMTDFELKVMTNKPSELPKMMISRRHGGNTIPKTSKSLLDAVKNRYMYQRVLLDEVALQMVYRASDKSIGERVRFKDLDDYLKSALLLAAILPLFPLDQYDPEHFVLMEVVPGDTVVPVIWEAYKALLNYYEPGTEVHKIERFAYYERAKKAYCVVATGEKAQYANIILKKGVVK